jgi:hypothetical protein
VTKRPPGRSRHVAKLATALFLLAAAGAAAGCGDDDRIADPGPTVQSDGPLVIYERAGGVAYTAQRMVVEEDGSATVDVEGPGGVGSDFELSDAELDKLRALLEAATLADQPEPSGCADCYAYTIDYAGQSATFDQVSYPPGTEPLVAFLSEIVEREAPSGPARDGS